MREWDGRCEKKDIDAHSAGYVCVWVRGGGTTRSGFIDPTAPAAIPPAQDGRARTQEKKMKGKEKVGGM
jgi:hypothetical protein